MSTALNSRLWTVANALGQEMETLINAAGITNPGAGFQGFPNYEDLTKIMQQGNEYVISVYPDDKGVKNTTRFFPQWMLAIPATVSFSSSVTSGSPQVISFTGTPQATVNIHTIVGRPAADAYYQTTGSDTLVTIATSVASAINALALPGIHASASFATVSVSGSPPIHCNLGSTATLSREARRESRLLQATIWSPNAVLRDNVYRALEGQIGMDDQPFLRLPDGTNFWCRWVNDILSDERQRDFAMYTAHIFFMCEYGIMRTIQATQIGALKQTLSFNGTRATTIVEG